MQLSKENHSIFHKKILKMEIAKNVFGVRTNDGYSGKADAGIIFHSFDDCRDFEVHKFCQLFLKI